MPTKTKKARKPTQLDRIEANFNARTMQLDALMDELDKLRADVFALLPPPQEIAAHKEAEVERKRKEQEAAELAKPIEFGTRVRFCLNIRKGKPEHEAKIACDGPDEDGYFMLSYQADDGLHNPTWRKRSEFTILP